MSFPDQDLACPDPKGCPILNPEDLPGSLPIVEIEPQALLYRVYDATWGYDEPNPGFGDTRFAPFDAVGDARRVPSLYAAETPTAALLETIFHAVHHDAPRWIEQDHLRNHLLAHLCVPADLRLVDLRDPVLAEAGIGREQVVSSPSEHYPCTRRIARHLHQAYVDTGRAHGLLWHSRQAEIADRPAAEVMVIFADSYGVPRGGWIRTGAGIQNLLTGAGRLRVDKIATDLGATINTG